jgi:hypothetical protein
VKKKKEATREVRRVPHTSILKGQRSYRIT